MLSHRFLSLKKRHELPTQGEGFFCTFPRWGDYSAFKDKQHSRHHNNTKDTKHFNKNFLKSPICIVIVLQLPVLTSTQTNPL